MVRLAVRLLILSALSGIGHADDRVDARWSGWCDLKQSPSSSSLNLPAWVCEAAYRAQLHSQFTIYTKINPFYVAGDFNGDGRTDVAIWVTNIRTKQRGIVIIHKDRSNSIAVLGAGTNTEGRGADYEGLDWWSTIPKGAVLNTTYESRRKVQLRGDAISIGRLESSSVAVYWDGKKYSYYQLSD